MKKTIILLCMFMTISSKSFMQGYNNKEKIYLEALNDILLKDIFDINEMIDVCENHKCFYYSRSDGFIDDTEKCYEFKYDDLIIKVWPSDHIFFYDIQNYVKVVEFNFLDKEIISLTLEKNIAQKAVKKIDLRLIKKNGKWEID